MHTTNILYRKNRRGISTVFGVIIFVGIMFTAVIPMFLVMRQADTIFEMRKHELEIVDEEKGREYLRVKISPDQGSSMTLKIVNKGDLGTKVIRLWVNEVIWLNEEGEDWNCLLNPNEVHEEILVVPTEPDSYSVIVVTEKGNVFVSDNALTHEGGGIWVQEDVYVIHVYIAYRGVIFLIEVTGPDDFYDAAMVQKIKGGTAYKAFILKEPGIYNVKIKSGPTIIYNKPVTLTEEDKDEVIDV